MFGLETAIVTVFAKNPVGLLLQDLITKVALILH